MQETEGGRGQEVGGASSRDLGLPVPGGGVLVARGGGR